jgi:L-iditol 2-dehydrogenase
MMLLHSISVQFWTPKGGVIEMNPNTMNTIQIEGPRKLSYLTTSIPLYREDEVLIRVRFIGVCATDLEIYDGSMSYFKNGKASYPITPGHEWSGEVVTLGSKVKDLSIGDRVVGETTISCGKCKLCLQGRYNLCPERVENGVMGKQGAGAQFMSYPTHALHRFKSSLSFEEAALIETAAVAYRGTNKLNITPSDKVAVIGAGPVGLLCVQIVKILGARHVTLVDLRENRLETGRKVGADETINIAKQNLEQVMRPIEESKRYTAVIEATGNVLAVESIFSYVAPAARVCLLGLCGGKRAKFDIDKLVSFDLEVHGSLSSPGVWEEVVHLFECGKLKAKELISHRLKLKDMEYAFELMEKKDETITKILLEP